MLPWLHVGNAPSVWFGGNSAPHLILASTDRWGAVVAPKVVARMVQGGSLRVLRPSYMPHFQYFRFASPTRGGRRRYVLVTFAHYSNGQEYDTLVRMDGSIKSRDGNCSTFYREAGFFDITPN